MHDRHWIPTTHPFSGDTRSSAPCRQMTTINQYPGTDASSLSQYSAVCITSINGLMLPDLVTNGGDYANFMLY